MWSPLISARETYNCTLSTIALSLDLWGLHRTGWLLYLPWFFVICLRVESAHRGSYGLVSCHLRLSVQQCGLVWMLLRGLEKAAENPRAQKRQVTNRGCTWIDWRITHESKKKSQGKSDNIQNQIIMRIRFIKNWWEIAKAEHRVKFITLNGYFRNEERLYFNELRIHLKKALGDSEHIEGLNWTNLWKGWQTRDMRIIAGFKGTGLSEV